MVPIARQPSGEPLTPGARRRAQIDPNLFPASRPMHRAAKPSLLSGLGMGGTHGGSTAPSEPPNLSGFINLVFCLFGVTHSAFLLENFLAHGLLISLPIPAVTAGAVEPLDEATTIRLVRTAASVALPILGAYAIERAAIKRTPFSRYSRRFVDPLHALNVMLSLASPCWLIHCRSHYGGIGGGITLLLLAVTSCLKLVSWSHVHHDLREADKESRDRAEGDLDARLAKYTTSVADTEGPNSNRPAPQPQALPPPSAWSQAPVAACRLS